MEQLTWTGERLVTSVNDQFFAIEHLHRYAMAVEISAGNIVLDIACGEGYGTNLLAQKSAFVYGVDIDSNTILHANKKYAVPGKNIEFRQGSTSAIPLEAATIDLVVSFETIEHHDEHEQMMKEIKRVLKPGGILIISSPNRSVYKQLIPNNIFHVKELEFEELKKLLGKNFEHCHYFEQQFVAGSLITSLGKDGYRLKFFDGNYEGISNEIHSVNYFNKPYYNIALCSDAEIELPAVSSLFNAAEIITKKNELNREKGRREIMNTRAFKIGQLFLKYFFFLRK